MKLRIPTLLLIAGGLFSWPLWPGCSDSPVPGPDGKPDTATPPALQIRIDSLIGICTMFTEQGEYSKVLESAALLMSLHDSTAHPDALINGNFYTGQALLLSNGEGPIDYYLDVARMAAETSGDLETLAKIHNAYGIFFTGMEMNHLEGIDHFMRSMEYSRRAGNERIYMMGLCNLAMTYYMRNDTAGLQYAEEVYKLGHERGDDYLIFGGGVISAYMRYMSGDHARALEYIMEMLPRTEKYNYHSELYSLYANILDEVGDSATAEHYYKLALEHINEEIVTAAGLTYLGYGSFLISKGRNDEAKTLLKEGIDKSEKSRNAKQRHLLYQRMSEAAANTGDHRTALHYYTLYHKEADSIFNVERERSINELRVKYQAEKQENELQQNRLRLIQEQRKVQLIMLLLLIVLLSATSFYILYRRKDRMYKQIVRQANAFLRHEKIMSATIPQSEDTIHQQRVRNREQDLFERIEIMMREQKAYCRPDITIEKLAEEMGTNRTYLSQTVNQHAGMSFSNYIARYRVNEAIRRLSDVEDDIPLKALATALGYRHIQTFYQAFRSAVGMTPSKYREKFISLYRKNEL